jgi:hypothetical protein
MDKKKLDKIIADHQKWLLDNTNLSCANLSYASLSGADLRGANLRYANLSDASLSGANLSDASLSSADLSHADLSHASLRGANLRHANLRGAKIADVFWCAPPVVLLANWGKCSDALTVQLMLHDASNHHDPRSFDVWATDGTCPYSGVKYQRAANFTESVKLWPGWNPRKKIMSAYQLMQLLLAERCDIQGDYLEDDGTMTARKVTT